MLRTSAAPDVQTVGRRVKSRRILRRESCYYSPVDEPRAQHVRAGYRSYARANHRHDPGNASCSVWIRRGPDRPRANAAKRPRLGRWGRSSGDSGSAPGTRPDRYRDDADGRISIRLVASTGTCPKRGGPRFERTGLRMIRQRHHPSEWAW